VTATTRGWVTRQAGAELVSPPGVACLALRRNPKRAHLLVSLLLGKHVPVPSGIVLSAAADLGARVRGAVTPSPAVVLGFAETATALGHGVAAVAGPDGTPAPYAHTTRRPLPAVTTTLAFEEEHSHAVEQTLGILDDRWLRDPERPLVLVDDEVSSGRTAVNAIRVLQRRWPRQRYVLASLLDVRAAEQCAATTAAVAALGADLTDVSLSRGQVFLPVDLPARAAELCAAPEVAPQASPFPAPVSSWSLELPAGTPLTGAHGWHTEAEAGLHEASSVLASRLRRHLEGSVLVLGDEEFMYGAQLTAAALGPGVRTSSTTRSPALVVDQPGYPLRTALRFGAAEHPDQPAYAYNVAPSARTERGTAPGFAHVVLVTDRPARVGLVDALAGAASASVHVVVMARGQAPRPVVGGPS
jgi:Phosphoribosyl transferase/TRSP domain C terminus to PRTase_2